MSNWRDTLGNQRNWFGEQSHPVDDFIHWSDRAPIPEQKRLKAAYDKIADAGLKPELDILLEAAKWSGKREESDSTSEGL